MKNSILITLLFAITFLGCEPKRNKEPKYTRADYNMEALINEWIVVPREEMGVYYSEKVATFLQDSLTDPVEAQMKFLFELIPDTTTFNSIAERLLKKVDGKSLFQKIYLRLDEEIIAYNDNRVGKYPGNKTSPTEIFRQLLLHQHRDPDFLRQAISQIGQLNMNGFDLTNSVVNVGTQSSFNGWVINADHDQKPEDRFYPEELEALYDLYRPRVGINPYVLHMDAPREYLGLPIN